MIRPFTCVCMLLAGASGLYLYQEKHRAQMLDREIANVVHQTETTRERSGVLRAEWTLQNDPERLAQLADRFLKLKTVIPGQFTTIAELDKRLPPVRPPEVPAEAAPDEDQQQPSVAAPESAEPARIAAGSEATKSEPAKPEPAKAEAKPEQPRKEASPPHPATAPMKLATAAPRPPERKPAAPLHEPALPPRVAAAETRSVIKPAIAALPRPIAPATYPVAAPVPAAPVVSSVLGIARTSIAPPVPFTPQTYGNGGGG